MDSSKKYENISPETSANYFSKLFFLWILPLFKIGLKKDLDVKDLYNTTKRDYSEQLGNILERNWQKEQTKAKQNEKRPSLASALIKSFSYEYSMPGLIIFIDSVIFKLTLPLVLAEFIKYFDPLKPYANWEGWLLASGIILISFASIFFQHHSNVISARIGMRCKISCCSLMYRKLLRLNKTSLNQTTAGQLINLMSNDVQRLEILLVFLHYIWVMPFQALVAGYLMYGRVGFSAIIGIAAIALQAIPLQGYLSKLQGNYRSQIATKTDYRVKIMSEITSGIQIIKMYAWEKPFEKVVQLARKMEIDVITKKSYILGFMTALMVFTERTSLYIFVIIYVLTGNQLSSDLVFSMAQFFNTLQLYMAILFPLGITFYAESKVSIKRIEDFLLLEENVKTYAISEPSQISIKISNGKASWMPNQIIDTLTNINIEIDKGNLIAIIGNVGSGKSSLLQLLLKELPLLNGKLEINGNVSYASQEPWLFISTVRNNILFGQPFDKKRYKEVVQVCALEDDFNQFPNGDKTFVGERGVSLSGGQRARINLARAIYRSADIYLLDDPLSAVDTHVGQHLFDKCIYNYLNGTTRILITHQLQYLKKADIIIIMNNGQIQKIGSYAELCDKELLLFKDVEQQQSDEINEINEDKSRIKRLLSITSESSTQDADEVDEPEETQELIEKGAIPTSLYWEYFHSGGSVLILIILGFMLILAQIFTNASDLWLRYWTNQEELYSISKQNKSEQILLEMNNETDFDITTDINYLETTLSTAIESLTTTIEDLVTNDTVLIDASSPPPPPLPETNYILIYTILIVLTVILTTLRSMFFYKICMKASKMLHNKMFNNILHATMRFFDTNPSGRILNRFSKDIGAIDEILPRCMLDALQVFLVMCGILMMVFIVSPLMIIPTAILACVYYLIRYIYMASAQDIRRLEGITKAPLFSHATASLNGLTTIRCANAQYLVAKEFDILQDQHTASFVMQIFASEAFGFYLDVISILFILIVTFQFFAYDAVLAGDVGLTISQSLILTGMLQFGMRQTAEVANNMTSVERVLQYTKLEKEGPFNSTPTRKPHRDWPNNGKMKFKNLFLHYVPTDPPILKNLNIDITAGDKIGIVGRTGAGKSSLIAAIFRLTSTDGDIVIDDVNTKDIGLYDLRSNISIIPQEPVLFSTTVRNNLDPFDLSNDETLWKALENVELKDVINKLEQEVSESGSNFSAGQRQLMCLARAIIRNNKIIIMDEATANVDQHTDTLIQQTIRNNFKDCTVLTIAHRLNTIMDSDKVIVMDAGEIVEYDHPHKLLEIENGYFTQLIEQTGKSMAANLIQIAKEAYEKKQQIACQSNSAENT